MILDQFELKNMALRFENSAWTTECFDMYSFFQSMVDLCSDPICCGFACLFSSVKLSLSVFDWSNASSSFDRFLSCRFCSHRDLKLKLTVQWNS